MILIIQEKIGKGIYCSPDIPEAECNHKAINAFLYTELTQKKIRIPKECENYWVINGNFNDIRPYKLLFKKSKDR